MPVDIFGRKGGRATPVYTEINTSNFINSFLRRYGVIPLLDIDMNSDIIKNVADPLSIKILHQELCRHKSFYYFWRCCV